MSVAVPQAVAQRVMGLRHAVRPREAADVAPLPGRLDRSWVVALPDEGHGPSRRHAVQHGDARQRRTSPPTPTAARDLHSLRFGATPWLAQGVLSVVAIDGQPEIRPADPSGGPRHLRRHTSEQVEAEVGQRAVGRRFPQATTADDSPGRQAQHPGSVRIPGASHGPKLRGASLITPFDYVWQRYTDRLSGLSDEEYLWEPVRGCWSLRRADNGRWQLDGGGGGGPAPEPVPVTTIARRIGHLAGMAVGGFADRLLADGTLTPDDPDYPPAVDELRSNPRQALRGVAVRSRWPRRGRVAPPARTELGS